MLFCEGPPTRIREHIGSSNRCNFSGTAMIFRHSAVPLNSPRGIWMTIKSIVLGLLATSFAICIRRCVRSTFKTGPTATTCCATFTSFHVLDDLKVEKLNPRCFSGWCDETFMHHVVEMSSGKELDALPSAVAQGWCVQALARWQSSFV